MQAVFAANMHDKVHIYTDTIFILSFWHCPLDYFWVYSSIVGFQFLMLLEAAGTLDPVSLWKARLEFDHIVLIDLHTSVRKHRVG